jgi:hypothetical protein
LHGDGAQGHAHHLLDRNEDQRQSRPAHAFEFAKQKNHPALVLLQDAKRNQEIDGYRNEKQENQSHGIAFEYLPLSIAFDCSGFTGVKTDRIGIRGVQLLNTSPLRMLHDAPPN